MWIRRNPCRVPGSSSGMPVQPRASPLEALAHPLLKLTPDSYVDAPAAAVLPVTTPPPNVCLQSCAWTSHPHALNPNKELDSCLFNDAWREPRESPGLAYHSVDFVLQQQEEVQMEVKDEEILLVKRKVDDKIEKHMQLQVHNKVNVSKKLNRDGNNRQNSPKRIITNVIKKEMEIASSQTLACNKTEDRKWKCQNNIVVPNTLCEYNSVQSCSYYGPGMVVPQASPIPAPMMASGSSKRARDESAPSSSKAVRVPVSSKAASSLFAGTQPGSKQPRKRKIDDYLGGEFYYYEPFGPFRGKQRGTSSSSNNRVEASVASIEERSSTQDGSIEAPESKMAF